MLCNMKLHANLFCSENYKVYVPNYENMLRSITTNLNI